MLLHALGIHFLFCILIHFLFYFLFFLYFFYILCLFVIVYFCMYYVILIERKQNKQKIIPDEKIFLFDSLMFRSSNSLVLSNWSLLFLSANEKCWLLLTTSGKFFLKNFIVNHSGDLVFVRNLEVSVVSNVQYWKFSL